MRGMGSQPGSGTLVEAWPPQEGRKASRRAACPPPHTCASSTGATRGLWSSLWCKIHPGEWPPLKNTGPSAAGVMLFINLFYLCGVTRSHLTLHPLTLLCCSLRSVSPTCYLLRSGAFIFLFFPPLPPSLFYFCPSLDHFSVIFFPSILLPVPLPLFYILPFSSP